MIEKALRYVVGLREAKIVEVNGTKYSDKEIYRVEQDLRADAIKMSTLGSLVDYIKSGADNFREKLLVHVVSPDEVELISNLDGDRKREKLVSVQANLPSIRLNSFIAQEEFVIMMQSQFVECSDSDTVGFNDKDIILQVAGNVVDSTVANYGDDGVTQKATIQTGIATKESIIVPNPVSLLPYRTFQEIAQIPTKFIFRMKNSERGGIVCALFEADGGAWKIAAVQEIAEFLKEELADYSDLLTVIA